jgi:hypothetical protein
MGIALNLGGCVGYTTSVKGFPNQIADLRKLAQGLRGIEQLVIEGMNPKDDGVLGETLVRSGVVGTGHTPIPIEKYLETQRLKTPDRQSMRTSARGLRELYRLLGLINDNGGRVTVTDVGHQAAGFADVPLGPTQIEFWRRVVRNLTHQGGDNQASHPYLVLLHLIARRPGILRAKCALALEARDDSPEELERIVALSDLDEDAIRDRIVVSRANWDNAKKLIPSFAEQLGDVIKVGGGYRLADSPGEAEGGNVPAIGGEARGPRRPRSSRRVTPATIGMAGIAEKDEPAVPTDLDPAAAAAAIHQRLDRLRRHNILVRLLASRLGAAGMTLFENPFDLLAVHERIGVLAEVKSLDGTEEDERERVRDALAQLLYYEAFVIEPVVGEADIHKVAVFERSISPAHQAWLNRSGIATIWMDNGRFAGDTLAVRILGPYLDELR